MSEGSYLFIYNYLWDLDHGDSTRFGVYICLIEKTSILLNIGMEYAYESCCRFNSGAVV